MGSASSAFGPQLRPPRVPGLQPVAAGAGFGAWFSGGASPLPPAATTPPSELLEQSQLGAVEELRNLAAE
eukprot:2129718-Pyramimonas_sp.AAC.1